MSDRDIILTDRVTIRLPAGLNDRLDTAVENGQFVDRSEAVREGLREVLDSADRGIKRRQEAD